MKLHRDYFVKFSEQKKRLIYQINLQIQISTYELLLKQALSQMDWKFD